MSTMQAVSSSTMIPPVPIMIVAPCAILGVDGQVEHRGRDAAARRPAGLQGLQRPVADHSAADLVDQLAERDAEGDFDQPGVLDRPFQREDRRARRALGAHGGVPGGAAGEDRRHAGPGLHVVDHGGLAPQALGDGIRRPGARLAGVAFERFDQGRLLAADVGPRPAADRDAERPAAAENVRRPTGRASRPRRWRVRGSRWPADTRCGRR